MVEPKELRIGSLVYPGNFLHDNEIVSVLEIFKGSYDQYEIRFSAKDASGQPYTPSALVEKCNPVPLTSEWLERFGFEKHEDLPPSYKIPNIDGWPIFVEGVLIDYVDGKIQSQAMCFSVQVQMEYEIAKVQYVHQLQNLYFALTGQELELKPKQ